MEGLKGEGLKKKTAFKQQMTLKQQMTWCESIVN